MRAFSWLVAEMSHFSLRPVIGHWGTDGRFFKYWKLINYFHHCGMQNQNIPGKPARHQGFSPPFSCWQPPAIGDTLNHLGADWSLKRRSKNETRYHRDQATRGLYYFQKWSFFIKAHIRGLSQIPNVSHREPGLFLLSPAAAKRAVQAPNYPCSSKSAGISKLQNRL